ncbi:MAG TPA: DinB family protein [Candidatus Dormibacteraeota bacterium]|nr:DinB family protein [Candidatus Dormibacteraeota bacterium]
MDDTTASGRITAGDLAELRTYLDRLLALLPRLRLSERVGGGATAGQLAFHAAESSDFWLRHVILGDERPRDREAEFTTTRSREEVEQAVHRAIAACEETARRAPRLDRPVTPPRLAGGRSHGDLSWTALMALLHATAHAAEHVGQLDVATAG